MRQLAAIAALSFAGMASAQGLVSFYGGPAIGCGPYLEARRGGSAGDDTYLALIRGFWSGYNMATHGPQFRSEIDNPTVLAYLDKYCRDNPMAVVYGGAIALVKETGAWPPKPR
jgi:hypothetical protein